MAWLGDLPFSRPGLEGQVEILRTFLHRDGGVREAGSCGLHQLLRARRDPRLRAHLRRLDLLIPSGPSLRGLTWLAADRAARGRPGCLFSAVLHAARLQEAPVFLLGSPGCEAYDLARRLRLRLPQVPLAGAHAIGAGMDGARGRARLAERIRRSGARFLACDPRHPFLEGFAREAPVLLPGVVVTTFWEGWPPRPREGLGEVPVQLTPRLLGVFGEALQRRFTTRRRAARAS